jgi:hypothetical protein
MPLLHESRCPKCDSGLPLKVLWEFSRSSLYGLVNRSGTLKGQIGIVCPNCGVKLRIVQTRIRAFLFLIWLVAYGVAWSVGEWIRHDHFPLSRNYGILGLVVLFSTIWLLQKYLIPHLAQARLAGADEQLGFPLSGAYGNRSDLETTQIDAKSAISNQPFERQ